MIAQLVKNPKNPIACNAGDPSLIPGLGRSAGEGIGYPLQYSWASLVAQLQKNPPTMRETWVWFLGWEDPLEKGTATPSSILAWKISWTEEPGKLQSLGSQRVGHNWATSLQLVSLCIILPKSNPCYSKWQDFLLFWLNNIPLCILFIHSSISGCLGCFCVLATVNSAAVNMGCRYLFWVSVFISSG